MDTNEAEYQYVSGQFRGTFPALFAQFEKANADALAAYHWQMDVPYGGHQRQTFDLCSARGRAAGTVLYLHAGYWQSRDKSQFRFLAPTLSDAGFNVAMINYPLCPDVLLSELSLGVRQALPAVISILPPDQRGLPVIVSGHSAGGHLAVELALAQDNTTPEQQRIQGIIAISGIYDLAPLMQTSLNIRLRLDAAQAQENSPLHRGRPGLPPAAFIVGGEETSDFLWQSQTMADAWSETGNAGEYFSIEGANHFSALQALQAPGGLFVKTIEKMIDTGSVG